MAATEIDSARSTTSGFYVWMAALCVVIAFGTFAPTYWLQLPARTFVGPPLLHLHAVLFSAWTLFFLSQTWLAASGRMAHHRAWGLAGVSLATAMVFVGAAAAIAAMKQGIAAGNADVARAFSIVSLTGILLFAILVAWAVATVKRPETHKRLMLLATLSLLQAPLGRIFFAVIFGVGPGVRPGTAHPVPVVTTVGSGLLVGVLILFALVYDWRKQGRPHPVYLIGGATVVFVEMIRVPLSTTVQWQAFAGSLVHFAG